MAEFRNTGDGGMPPGFSDETVTKVGRAVGDIAAIRQAYQEGLTKLDSEDDKQELAQRAEGAAVQAISEQGLSVAEYNHVVDSASNDPDLQQRLLRAAGAG